MYAKHTPSFLWKLNLVLLQNCNDKRLHSAFPVSPEHRTLVLLSIATDKRGYPHIIFLISRRKHMLWVLIRSASMYVGEALLMSTHNIHWGTSNEYPQHMFSSRNKKDISIFRMKKAPYLLLWEHSTLILENHMYHILDNIWVEHPHFSFFWTLCTYIVKTFCNHLWNNLSGTDAVSHVVLSAVARNNSIWLYSIDFLSHFTAGWKKNNHQYFFSKNLLIFSYNLTCQ